MDIPYVNTDVTTEDSNILLHCFEPPMFGISRDKAAVLTDALVLTPCPQHSWR